VNGIIRRGGEECYCYHLTPLTLTPLTLSL
jgi:hypothetical protein